MEAVFSAINTALTVIDDAVWGVPTILLILVGGIFLTCRVRGLQFKQLGRALRYMMKNEKGGSGEVTSFGALCTALSATIGTGNIVGVATAIIAGGPGALFWMWVAALFGMATKYSEGLLAVKFRNWDHKTGHALGGPFYYIEHGMGKSWRWLAKLFAFFGVCVGLFGIGTFTQVNSISTSITSFFDPNKAATVQILGMDYSWATVIGGLLRFLAHYLVGALVWGKYMPDEFFGMSMTSPWFYSLLYNGSYMLPDIILCAVVFALLYRPLKKYFTGADLIAA